MEVAVRRFQWARLGSNQRPLACEASALPLSYAPEDCNLPAERSRRIRLERRFGSRR
jgi:hypothetical protein